MATATSPPTPRPRSTTTAASPARPTDSRPTTPTPTRRADEYRPARSAGTRPPPPTRSAPAATPAPRRRSSGVERQLERTDGASEQVRLDVRLTHHPQVREPRRQRRERLLQQLTGQRRPQAEVRPVPEGQVRVRRPSHVERERVCEHGLVTVGRRVQ